MYPYFYLYLFVKFLLINFSSFIFFDNNIVNEIPLEVNFAFLAFTPLYYKLLDNIEKLDHFFLITAIGSFITVVINYQFINVQIDWYNIKYPMFILFIVFWFLMDYHKYKEMYIKYEFKPQKSDIEDVL